MAQRLELLITLADLAGEHARQVILGLRQPLAPSWILVGSDRKTHVIATPWRDDAEKKLMAQKMRNKIRQNAIVAYSFVCEAWAATKPRGWTPEKGGGAKDDPKRRECVIAMATDGKDYEWRCWLIKRDHLETITGLEPDHDFPGGAPEGWMTQLLSPAT
jgi:hypothetical protein